MVKTIIREIFIMLLLCVAIVLVFAITLYDYIPINKVIPEKVTYEVPEDIKVELESNVSTEEAQPLNIVYSVDASDLEDYEQSGSYVPGKPNPFEAYTSNNGNSTILGENTTTQKPTEEYYPSNTSTK